MHKLSRFSRFLVRPGITILVDWPLNSKLLTDRLTDLLTRDSLTGTQEVRSEEGVLQNVRGISTCRDSFRQDIVQELCESRGGRPGLSVLTSLLVSVDVKIY